MTTRLLSDLRIAADNPRIATAGFHGKLERAMKEFGDLSAIIYNRQTVRLLAGNQRTTVAMRDPNAQVIIEHELPEADGYGTVAVGYVLAWGTRYTYREVIWDLKRELAARTIANYLHAETDSEGYGRDVRAVYSEDKDLAELMLRETKDLESLLAGGELGEKPDGDIAVKPKVHRYDTQTLKSNAARYGRNVDEIVAFIDWQDATEAKSDII